MTKTRRLLLTIGLGAAVATGVAACGGGSSTKTSATTTSAAPSSGGSSGRAGADTIVIKNFAFMSPTITVKAGTTVSVHNEDSTTHTLTATNGAFTTGGIAPGSTKTFTAPKAGRYSYDCQIHQYMTGTLIVTS